MSVLDRLALDDEVRRRALHDISRHKPASGRRISAIGARTGIMGDQPEQVVYDVITAGPVDRHVDDARPRYAARAGRCRQLHKAASRGAPDAVVNAGGPGASGAAPDGRRAADRRLPGSSDAM